MTPQFFNKNLADPVGPAIFSSVYNNLQESNQFIDPEILKLPTDIKSGQYYNKISTPCTILTKSALDSLKSIYQLPNTILIKNSNYTLSASLFIYHLKTQVNHDSENNATVKNLNIVYQPMLWLKRGNHKKFEVLPHIDSSKNGVIIGYTSNPKKWFLDQLSLLKASWQNNFTSWFDNLNNHDLLINQADYLTNNFTKLINHYYKNQAFVDSLNTVYSNYDLPLSTYQAIIKILRKKPLNLASYNKIIAQNEYLLLYDNLADLKHKNNHKISNLSPLSSNSYNYSQLDAINSNYKLNLLQSVAGSGKSHTILGRIKRLINNHINPTDITVLSFTKAAASHIQEYNNQINSLTISKLIHDEYTNHLDHKLSNIDTLINSINLNYTYNNQLASEFVNLLSNLKSSSKAQINLYNFVLTNYQAVLAILDNLNQTTLELEEIIAYINLNKWSMLYQTKYLIIDEVQDTSIFQFIFLLRYIKTFNCNAMLVGDASQTLYEFRDANPNALNALEKSGYFKIFKLETNYRSNPAILLYANQILQHIKANEFAHLNLKAPGFDKIGVNLNHPDQSLTKTDFQNIVLYKHYKGLSSSAINHVFAKKYLDKDLRGYLTNNLQNNKQTAFLVYTRKQAALIAQSLSTYYPNQKVVNLANIQFQSINILSQYLAKYGHELIFIPTDNFPQILFAAIKGKISLLSLSWAEKQQAQRVLDSLYPAISSYWPSQLHKYQSGVITHQKLIAQISTFLLDFEIQYNINNQKYFDNNSVKQTEEIKNSNFIVSTIHGVKGLEFDNTVNVIFSNQSLHQDMLRLYYVALTRAKNSEVIIEVNTAPNLFNVAYQNALQLLP